ncbi:MAG: lytic transglycosylase domain-containing protein [Clostridia bacterium]|nr:lytic transglycosylase domain-containing protein [Clostridia bacterium]
MKKIKPAWILAVVAILLALGLLWHFGYKRLRMAAYPMKYPQLVEKYAKQNNLQPALVFAVIRCESSFNPNAVSSIGALGLMQITPDTFQWEQSKLHEKAALTADALYDPETNIRYGTALLAQLTTEFTVSETALAAYHAGPSKVKKWLADSSYSHDHLRLYYIPFADTRAYVRKVIATEQIYLDLYQ